MGIAIYAYDNQTGRDIPEKVDTYLVTILTGSKLSDIHESITPGSQLFFMYTHLPDDMDIVVPSSKDAEVMKKILSFGKLKYKVTVKESSTWYSNRVKKNIIFSDSVNINADKMSQLLTLYLNGFNISADGPVVSQTKELYSVYNVRSNTTIYKTPLLDEAIKYCDKNPCCVVKKKGGDIIHTSNFGRVTIPPAQETTRTAKYKVRVKNGLASIGFSTR